MADGGETNSKDAGGTGPDRSEDKLLRGVKKVAARETRRYKRTQYLSFCVMLLALAAAIAFAIYGRSDRELIKDDAKAAAEAGLKNAIGDSGESIKKVAGELPNILAASDVVESFKNFTWEDERGRMDDVLKTIATQQRNLSGEINGLSGDIRTLKTEFGKIDLGGLSKQMGDFEQRLIALEKKDDLADELGKLRRDVQGLNARVQALEKPEDAERFDLRGWQAGVKRLIEPAHGLKEPRRAIALDFLEEARTFHLPYSHGGKSTAEALKVLNIRFDKLKSSR